MSAVYTAINCRGIVRETRVPLALIVLDRIAVVGVAIERVFIVVAGVGRKTVRFAEPATEIDLLTTGGTEWQRLAAQLRLELGTANRTTHGR